MDWADRIIEEERARRSPPPPRTLATSAEELRSLLQKPPKAHHSASLHAALNDACNYGLRESGSRYADLHRAAMARLRQLEELKAHGHPKTINDLVNVCLSFPADAEPSSEGWRVERRATPTRPVHHFWRRCGETRNPSPMTSFASSLEEVPNALTGMSALGMTHALRALSRFRAASSHDVEELIQLVRGSSNPWVGGVGLTALASSNDRGLDWQGLPSLVELAPRLLQVVAAFPRGPYGAQPASWTAPGDPTRRRQQAHLASEARRAALVVLTRIEPCMLARREPSLASALDVVTPSLTLGGARVRRHTLETLLEVQAPTLLAPLAAVLLEHARSCDSRELAMVSELVARVPDAELERTLLVLSPAPMRPRQQLGLQVLLRLAGPCLDTLLRDAQASAEGLPLEAVDDSDAAREARLDELLNDVAVDDSDAARE